MRIVVTEHAVQMYTDAADQRGCDCSAFIFPVVGACSISTDAGPCSSGYCGSCITDFGVEVNGTRVPPRISGGYDPWTLYYTGALPSSGLSLVLEGCGHPSTRIPLDGPAFPQTTATADYIDDVPHVSWASDAPSLGTLLTFFGPISPDLCHVQGETEHSFTHLPYERVGTSVLVQSLVSRTDINTDFGAATIWRAGSSLAPFPSPRQR
jgi:hypothetical protein